MEFISVLSEAQIREVTSLAGEIWREHYAGILSAGQIEYMLGRFQSEEAVREQISAEKYSYYLLRDGAETLGFFGFCRRGDEEHAPGKRGLFLSKLYIRKACRGRGAARAAVHFLQRLCQEEGISYLWLTVNRENTGSIACYRKLGFSQWYGQCADIGGGYVMDDLILRKDL